MPRELTELEVLELLEEGLEKDAREWRDWLRQLGLAEASRERLEGLLLQRTQAEKLDTHFDPVHTLKTGDRIGAFKLAEVIGEGGMGQVFRARRVADDFEQDVAIKLLGRGMKSDTVRALFENERRILAGLNHANIATLYDGGQTEGGTPYVVMELVEGVPITAFVQQHGLSTEASVRLFLDVCAGIQTAHESLVIHRDIKPSNVMVNADGVVKILDFGIAKQMQLEADDATQAVSMTPMYASPEQLRGERLTMASDVYSLGVLLYELLCGEHPAAGALTAVQVEQTIRDGIEMPSRRAANAEVMDALSGDLDAIVMSALEEDAARRYQSAEQLAADLERYLAGYPVEAVPRSKTYVFKRFVRRNRAAAVFASTALVALLVGFAATTWQFQTAQDERDRTRQINELLTSVLLSPSQWSRYTHGNEIVLDKDASVVELWALLEQQILDRDIDPDIKVEVLSTLSESFLNLDRWEEAIRIGERAVAIADAETAVTQANRVTALRILTLTMHKSNHPQTAELYERLLGTELTVQEQANVMPAYATWLRGRGDYKGAERYFDLAIEAAERLGEPLTAAYIYGNSALLLCDRARYEACTQRLARAAELWDTSGEPPNVSLYRALADAQFFKGDYQAALEYANVAVERGQAMIPDTVEHMRALLALLTAQTQNEMLDEARQTRIDMVRVADTILDDKHPDWPALLQGMARLDLAQGNADEAVAKLQKARDMRTNSNNYTLFWSRVDQLEGQARMQAGMPGGEALVQRAERYVASLSP